MRPALTLANFLLSLDRELFNPKPGRPAEPDFARTTPSLHPPNPNAQSNMIAARKSVLLLLTLAAATTFTACTPGQKGAVVGGAIGAGTGALIGDGTGALIGGAVGAVAGSAVAKNRAKKKYYGY